MEQEMKETNGNIHTDCIASATRGVAPGFCI